MNRRRFTVRCEQMLPMLRLDTACRQLKGVLPVEIVTQR